MENNNEMIIIPVYRISTSNWAALDMVAVKKTDCPIERETEQVPGDKDELSICVNHHWKWGVTQCPYFKSWGIPYGGRSQIMCGAKCKS
ncbi:hypothetical protein AM501_09890 [Aneurinibacillus migulanus]|uniref:hypothetical protein n=1 Tax=Aneurinibacillus migulanus TaxID=47500 RepID=UPI0005BC4994|nr:hypothetical protein [Aneurinibacillus migulanus]KIV56455.1 hypothetical protein TS64_09305 [Aneurinibacillus migulanus]KPD08463.1 hypothetical protein AM501_09890 [Aneurinibacillus migulanus]